MCAALVFHRLARFVALLLTACALLRAAEPEPLPAIDDKWRHLRSQNFELYSRNGEAESRELLHHLELVRAVFLERFKFVERARLDVTVFYFRSTQDFHAYASETMVQNGKFAGFYLHRPDRAIISIGPIASWQDAQPIIFHEYIHHLFRTTGADPPSWFNEGIAELLASIQVKGDTLEIGHPHIGRILALREGKLLPLDTLFAVTHDSPVFTSPDHTGIFYAESWALLHYWYFGESGLPKDAVTRFVRVAGERHVASGAGLRPFFQECFGFDFPEMERRLGRYVETGRYRFGRQPAPTIAVEKTYAVRSVPREELRLRLAELALRVQRSAAAKFVLIDALARAQAANAKPDPRVLEVLGMDALSEGDELKARERWEQALDAGSQNIAIVRELGLLESRTWFRQFDYYFQLPAETAERLRGRLLRAIEHEPEQSAAYEMLAWVEAFSEQPVIANVNLVQRRFRTLREQARTVLALALVRVRMREPAEALELLDRVETFETDHWTTHAVQIVRAKLAGNGGAKNSAATAAAPSAASAPMTEAALRPRVRVPSVELPEKYRGK